MSDDRPVSGRDTRADAGTGPDHEMEGTTASTPRFNPDPRPEPEPAAAVLDARGLRCPLPVIRLAALVRDRPELTTVVVLATDPAAAHDMPAWCRMRGHTFVGTRAEPGGGQAHEVRLSRGPATRHP